MGRKRKRQSGSPGTDTTATEDDENVSLASEETCDGWSGDESWCPGYSQNVQGQNIQEQVGQQGIRRSARRKVKQKAEDSQYVYYNTQTDLESGPSRHNTLQATNTVRNKPVQNTARNNTLDLKNVVRKNANQLQNNVRGNAVQVANSARSNALQMQNTGRNIPVQVQNTARNNIVQVQNTSRSNAVQFKNSAGNNMVQVQTNNDRKQNEIPNTIQQFFKTQTKKQEARNMQVIERNYEEQLKQKMYMFSKQPILKLPRIDLAVAALSDRDYIETQEYSEDNDEFSEMHSNQEEIESSERRNEYIKDNTSHDLRDMKPMIEKHYVSDEPAISRRPPRKIQHQLESESQIPVEGNTNHNVSIVTANKVNKRGRANKRLKTLEPNSENIHMCHICGKNFKTDQDLVHHFNDVHIRHKYQCTICKKSFRTFQNLQAHTQEEHVLPETFSCTVCNDVFMNLAELNIHMASHANQRVSRAVRNKEACHECPSCEREFISKVAMIEHIKKGCLNDNDTSESNGSEHDEVASESDSEQGLVQMLTETVVAASPKGLIRTPRRPKSQNNQPVLETLLVSSAKGLVKTHFNSPQRPMSQNQTGLNQDDLESIPNSKNTEDLSETVLVSSPRGLIRKQLYSPRRPKTRNAPFPNQQHNEPDHDGKQILNENNQSVVTTCPMGPTRTRLNSPRRPMSINENTLQQQDQNQNGQLPSINTFTFHNSQEQLLPTSSNVSETSSKGTIAVDENTGSLYMVTEGANNMAIIEPITEANIVNADAYQFSADGGTINEIEDTNLHQSKMQIDEAAETHPYNAINPPKNKADDLKSIPNNNIKKIGNPKTKTEVQCVCCDASFRSKRKLQKHETKHEEDGTLMCKECGYCTETLHDIMIHVGGEYRQCPDMDTVHNWSDNEVAESITNEPENTASDDVSRNYTASSKVTANNDVSSTNIESNAISNNNNTESIKVSINSMENNENNTETIACLCCDMFFKDFQELVKHEQVHEDDGTVMCKECGFSGDAMGQVLKHVGGYKKRHCPELQEDGEEPIPDDEQEPDDDQEPENSYNLVLQNQQNQQNQQADASQSIVNDKHINNNNTALLTNNIPLTKCLCCDAMYTSSDELSFHEIRHEKDGTLMCEDCGDVYETLDQIYNHVGGSMRQCPNADDENSFEDTNQIPGAMAVIDTQEDMFGYNQNQVDMQTAQMQSQVDMQTAQMQSQFQNESNDGLVNINSNMMNQQGLAYSMPSNGEYISYDDNSMSGDYNAYQTHEQHANPLIFSLLNEFKNQQQANAHASYDVNQYGNGMAQHSYPIITVKETEQYQSDTPRKRHKKRRRKKQLVDLSNSNVMLQRYANEVDYIQRRRSADSDVGYPLEYNTDIPNMATGSNMLVAVDTDENGEFKVPTDIPMNTISMANTQYQTQLSTVPREYQSNHNSISIANRAVSNEATHIDTSAIYLSATDPRIASVQALSDSQEQTQVQNNQNVPFHSSSVVLASDFVNDNTLPNNEQIDNQNRTSLDHNMPLSNNTDQIATTGYNAYHEYHSGDEPANEDLQNTNASSNHSESETASTVNSMSYHTDNIATLEYEDNVEDHDTSEEINKDEELQDTSQASSNNSGLSQLGAVNNMSYHTDKIATLAYEDNVEDHGTGEEKAKYESLPNTSDVHGNNIELVQSVLSNHSLSKDTNHIATLPYEDYPDDIDGSTNVEVIRVEGLPNISNTSSNNSGLELSDAASSMSKHGNITTLAYMDNAEAIDGATNEEIIQVKGLQKTLNATESNSELESYATNTTLIHNTDQLARPNDANTERKAQEEGKACNVPSTNICGNNVAQEQLPVVSDSCVNSKLNGFMTKSSVNIHTPCVDNIVLAESVITNTHCVETIVPAGSVNTNTPCVENIVPTNINTHTPCVENIVPAGSVNTNTPCVKNIVPTGSVNTKTHCVEDIVLAVGVNTNTPCVENIVPAGSVNTHTPCEENIVPGNVNTHTPCVENIVPARSVNPQIPCVENKVPGNVNTHTPCVENIVPAAGGNTHIPCVENIVPAGSVNTHTLCVENIVPAGSVNTHIPCVENIVPAGSVNTNTPGVENIVPASSVNTNTSCVRNIVRAGSESVDDNDDKSLEDRADDLLKQVFVKDNDVSLNVNTVNEKEQSQEEKSCQDVDDQGTSTKVGMGKRATCIDDIDLDLDAVDDMYEDTQYSNDADEEPNEEDGGFDLLLELSDDEEQDAEMAEENKADGNAGDATVEMKLDVQEVKTVLESGLHITSPVESVIVIEKGQTIVHANGSGVKHSQKKQVINYSEELFQSQEVINDNANLSPKKQVTIGHVGQSQYQQVIICSEGQSENKQFMNGSKGQSQGQQVVNGSWDNRHLLQASNKVTDLNNIPSSGNNEDMSKPKKENGNTNSFISEGSKEIGKEIPKPKRKFCPVDIRTIRKKKFCPVDIRSKLYGRERKINIQERPVVSDTAVVGKALEEKSKVNGMINKQTIEICVPVASLKNIIVDPKPKENGTLCDAVTQANKALLKSQNRDMYMSSIDVDEMCKPDFDQMINLAKNIKAAPPKIKDKTLEIQNEDMTQNHNMNLQPGDTAPRQQLDANTLTQTSSSNDSDVAVCLQSQQSDTHDKVQTIDCQTVDSALPIFIKQQINVCGKSQRITKSNPERQELTSQGITESTSESKGITESTFEGQELNVNTSAPIHTNPEANINTTASTLNMQQTKINFSALTLESEHLNSESTMRQSSEENENKTASQLDGHQTKINLFAPTLEDEYLDTESTMPQSSDENINKTATVPGRHRSKINFLAPTLESEHMDTESSLPDSPQENITETASKLVRQQTKINFSAPNIESEHLDTESSMPESPEENINKTASKPERQETKINFFAPTLESEHLDTESSLPDSPEENINTTASKLERTQTKINLFAPTLEVDDMDTEISEPNIECQGIAESTPESHTAHTNIETMCESQEANIYAKASILLEEQQVKINFLAPTLESEDMDITETTAAHQKRSRTTAESHERNIILSLPTAESKERNRISSPPIVESQERNIYLSQPTAESQESNIISSLPTAEGQERNIISSLPTAEGQERNIISSLPTAESQERNIISSPTIVESPERNIISSLPTAESQERNINSSTEMVERNTSSSEPMLESPQTTLISSLQSAEEKSKSKPIRKKFCPVDIRTLKKKKFCPVDIRTQIYGKVEHSQAVNNENSGSDKEERKSNVITNETILEKVKEVSNKQEIDRCANNDNNNDIDYASNHGDSECDDNDNYNMDVEDSISECEENSAGLTRSDPKTVLKPYMFACRFCEQSFIFPKELKQHVTKCHPGETTLNTAQIKELLQQWRLNAVNQVY